MSWNRVAVVGAGLIKFGELFEQSYETMAAGAFRAACDAVDKGFDPSSVDAAFVATQRGTLWGQEGISGNTVPTALGLAGIPCTRIENACPSGSDAFRVGAMAVASGVHDIVLVIGVEKMRDKSTEEGLLSRAAAGHPILTHGETAPVLFAPFATRHMHEFGTTREMLASVAVKNHHNGALDPYAHFQNEITVEQCLAAPAVCSPLHLLDCCPQTDGAAATILVPAERAHEFTDNPVYVAGFGVATDHPYLHEKTNFVGLDATVAASKRAYEMAGVGPGDIDIAEVHDCFTITEILDIEDLGFVDKGKGGVASLEGETSLTGRIPVNTSGGLLAKGHPIGATGVAQMTECWWQLRGQADERQVEIRNGYALQHNVGGRGSGVSVVNILTNRAREDLPVTVTVETSDGVRVITLDRPEAKHALTPEMRDTITDAVRSGRTDPAVRSFLITATGDAFCSGMDLTASTVAEAGTPGFDPRTTAEVLRAGVQAFIRELWELDKPTVAAVNGTAVGPGAHLALACDFVLVHPETRFIWSFHRWGIVADAGGAYLLPRLVGLPRAKAMLMLGEGCKGAEAVDLGLAYRCVASPEALRDEAQALAARLAAGPTRSLGLTKKLLNATFETDLPHLLDLEGTYQSYATTTNDLVEGLVAFRERRDADFTGT